MIYFPCMKDTATITTKRQLTLPVRLFRLAKLKEGQKVGIHYHKGELVIRPLNQVIQDLAGSVQVPKVFKGKSIDEIISQAKKEYFRNRI